MAKRDNKRTSRKGIRLIAMKRMNKNEAIAKANTFLGHDLLTNANTTFSNENKSKPVWWMNPGPEKFMREHYLLLARCCRLILVEIEADTFPDPKGVFRFREDKGRLDIEISCDRSNLYMHDIKSEYDFSPHVKREFVGENREPLDGRVDTRRRRVAKVKVTFVSTTGETVFNPGDTLPPLVDLDGVPDDGPLIEGGNVPVQYMFKYLEEMHNLHAFLDDFPHVSMEQALAAIRERVRSNNVIHSDRKTVSGAPIFKGTRLPLSNLFDYLKAGFTLDVFLDHFPTADREQAIAALNQSRELLESVAYESAV